MLLSVEFLGPFLLVTSAAALGLSIIMDVGRLGAERARQLALQGAIDKKRAATREWAARTSKHRAAIDAMRDRHGECVARKRRALNELRTIEFGRIEMVHEIEGDQPIAGYWMLLVTRPEFAEVDRRDVVFSRQIWEFRNVAHIWAGSPETATLLARGAFSQRSGVLLTAPMPLTLALQMGDGRNTPGGDAP